MNESNVSWWGKKEDIYGYVVKYRDNLEDYKEFIDIMTFITNWEDALNYYESRKEYSSITEIRIKKVGLKKWKTHSKLLLQK